MRQSERQKIKIDERERRRTREEADCEIGYVRASSSIFI